MKLRQFILIILLILLGLQFVVGQEKPKAQLIDEVSPTNCCDLGARNQNIMLALQDNKDSTGYIILFYTKAKFYHFLYLERTILASLDYAKIKNVKVIRQSTTDNFKIQFWFVPNGAEINFSTQDENDFKIKSPEKPLMFADTTQPLCIEKGFEKQFAEILSANSNLRGNVVINTKSKNQFLKMQKSLRNELVNIHQISKTKIRFFYSKNEYDYLEFWLVPKRRKS